MPSAPLTSRSRRALLAASAALLLLCSLAAAAAAAVGGKQKLPLPGRERPNVVVIQTDDASSVATWQTYFDPLSGFHVPVMPNTMRLLVQGGMNFTRYYTPDPLCCPSRVSLLTGSYAKNTDVRGNGPNGGGYPQFVARDVGYENLPVWLKRAGYRTIHIGKFLNYYAEPPYSSPNDIPPGWSDWQTLAGEQSTHLFYGYTMNENGTLTGPYGDDTYAVKDPPSCPYAPLPGESCNYQTDVLTQRAVSQIAASAADGRPFFLSLDYVAPHGDYRNPSGPEPAPRHYDSMAALPLPKPPGFNEGNVNDKPSFIRHAPLLTPIEIRRTKIEYRKEVESLRAVDDGVANIIGALQDTGELSNTYVFFTSDNGFFQGEHRLQRSKFLPYEPAVRVPLFLRGPGVQRGSRSGELAANIDLAPTILRLARARPTRAMDGRSLLPFIEDPAKRTQRALLLEAFTRSVDVGTARPASRSARSAVATASVNPLPEDYYGIRVGRYKWIEYADGQKELYDLQVDPYEINSRQKNKRYFPVRAFLHKWLLRFQNCRGASCKRLITEEIPDPKPLHPGRHKKGQQPTS
jgi:N-acetylglucosamine-6-sulfatase